MISIERLRNSWRIKRVYLFPWLLQRRIRNADDLDRFAGFRSARVVTFDVFDTALLRSVAQPADAIALACWRAEGRLASGIKMQDLLEARLAAEKLARKAALAAGREEVTLDEIYANFLGALYEAGPVLRSEELATERDVCCSNPVILAIYRKMIAADIPVAFISDTSLPESFLGELLRDNGYSGPHTVFASSAFGASKSHGALFSLVASRLGIPPSDIWHIGDNARSDAFQARLAGVNGLWFRPRLGRPSHQKEANAAVDERGIARSLMSGIPESLSAGSAGGESPLRGIGFTVAGPLYLGFTQWLIKRLAEFAPERIYFCSRDGRIVQKVYEILRELLTGLPEPVYLMVSRRSLVFPAMEKFDDFTLGHLCGASNQQWMNVGTFLTRIGLDPQDYGTAMLKHGLSAETVIDCDEQRRKLRSMFQYLEKDILDASRRERVLLVRYLKQEGCFETAKLGLCDIGWKGSLQRALGAILRSENSNVQVSGYYLGTDPDIEKLPVTSGAAAAWLMNAGMPEGRRRVLQTGLNLVEMLFTTKHGSVYGYCDSQGRIGPILDDLGIEAGFVTAAETIQAAALQFVQRYVRAFGCAPAVDLDSADVFPSLVRLIDRPTLLEARTIGDIVHVHGFGVSQLGQPIAKPPSFWQSLATPSKTIAKFRQSPWRLGFLVRLIGIPSVATAAMTIRRRLEFRARRA